MGALATRVRFFQQQGYDATLAVSSGVAHLDGQLDRQGRPVPDRHPDRPVPVPLHDAADGTGGGSGSSTAHLVWLIVIAIVVVGVLLGLRARHTPVAAAGGRQAPARRPPRCGAT